MTSKRLLVVFILGFSSGLPLALISSTLQAWFAYSGMSVLATGTLSLISLPYAYRFLWAPILDKYPLFSLGKRRSWILAMQALLLLGFNAMAWCNPEQYPGFMACFALLLACLSATQDLAIDAHRAEYLPIPEQALGASLAVLGYRIALLISGGLALILAQHLGFAFTYRLMGFIMLIGMAAVIFSQEPLEKKSPSKLSFVAPLKELLARPGILMLFCFIFCYKLGEAFTTTTSGIVMPFLIQGLGFSLETLGYINKMLGIGAILLGGIVAGLFLLRCSLYSALLGFGLLQALTNVFFVLLAAHGKSVPLLAVAVFADNFAAGLGSTALVALFMQLVDKRYTGTQFSLFVALSALPRILSGPLAASLQLYLGWVGLYELSVILALLFVPFLLKSRHFLNIPVITRDDKEKYLLTLK